jgi:hypothetical protein
MQLTNTFQRTSYVRKMELVCINTILHTAKIFLVGVGRSYVAYCSSFSIVRGDMCPIHFALSRIYCKIYDVSNDKERLVFKDMYRSDSGLFSHLAQPAFWARFESGSPKYKSIDMLQINSFICAKKDINICHVTIHGTSILV